MGILLLAGGVWFFLFFKKPEPPMVTFFVQYNGAEVTTHTAQENVSIAKALEEAGYALTDKAFVFPARGGALTRGTTILVHSEKQIYIEDHDQAFPFTTSALTVQEALEEKGIQLAGADFVEPSLETLITPDLRIHITRVTVTEETETKPIPFKKTEKEDDTVSFLIKKVTQKGEPGILESRYKVSRHNGEIVAKEKIEEKVIKEPTEEILTIGTKVTVVKKHTGGASWYAHTGTLSAANPWLPFGSYVRVTNTANGKSVIVKINDRGPFGPGRIIDLDKEAFAKIADLGTGVIQVVMEEIK